MSKPIVFISCGQCTPEEIQLGKQIAHYVKSAGLQPFFAEEVHDLNGLQTNILAALHECAAFIMVMHPRGEIKQLSGNVVVRASVWIEQEIAIAAYIQAVEKRNLPVIAFVHKDVHIEGLRQLLHLNPIRFSKSADVTFKLPMELQNLNIAPHSEIRLELEAIPERIQDGHRIKMVRLSLINNSNQRITQYNGEIAIPAGVLSHWNSHYPTEIRTKAKAADTRRRFRFDETGRGTIVPHDRMLLFATEYCTECGLQWSLQHKRQGIEDEINATVWTEGQEYVVKRTMQALALEMETKL